jgi:polyisoprenoid-binding protein YceI
MNIHDHLPPAGGDQDGVRTDPPEGHLERWLVDAARSSLTFTLRHLVIAQIRGRFDRWGGVLFLDRAEPWLSSLQVWIDLASISTGDLERDAHVKSAEFLDVAHHPRAEFRSTAVDAADDVVAVRGRLDLHGVARDLELEVETIGASSDDSGLRSRYIVRGTIDRQAFGLHWNQDLDVGGVVVGDDISLTAEVELVRLPENGTADSF